MSINDVTFLVIMWRLYKSFGNHKRDRDWVSRCNAWRHSRTTLLGGFHLRFSLNNSDHGNKIWWTKNVMWHAIISLKITDPKVRHRGQANFFFSRKTRIIIIEERVGHRGTLISDHLQLRDRKVSFEQFSFFMKHLN